MIDIAIISAARNPELKAITEQAVRTLHENTPKPYTLTVAESVPNVTYNADRVFKPNAGFNYNQYGNLALKGGKNPYVGLFNNDVVFKPEWWDKLLDAMQKNGLDSASPYCPKAGAHEGIPENSGVRIGYKVRQHISGWAIVLKRAAWEKIGGFPQEFEFHYSDDVYGMALQAHGLRHGLVTGSVVVHLESKTLSTLPDAVKDRYTVDAKKRYKNKYK